MSTPLTPDEIARSHRWHAVECNNLAWKLSNRAGRSAGEDDAMLNAAHASAFHWEQVGTELHRARAWMLLGQVHAALGMGPTAQSYAQRSYEYLAAHQAPDWEIAFAHAILAHAAHAAGDPTLHQRHHAQARDLGRAIADPEDRKIFFETFDLIPSP